MGEAEEGREVAVAENRGKALLQDERSASLHDYLVGVLGNLRTRLWLLRRTLPSSSQTSTARSTTAMG